MYGNPAPPQMCLVLPRRVKQPYIFLLPFFPANYLLMTRARYVINFLVYVIYYLLTVLFRYFNLHHRQYRCPGTKRPKRRFIPLFGR